MPKVDGKEYPYTKEGKADAAKAQIASNDARDRKKEFRAGGGKIKPIGNYKPGTSKIKPMVKDK